MTKLRWVAVIVLAIIVLLFGLDLQLGRWLINGALGAARAEMILAVDVRPDTDEDEGDCVIEYVMRGGQIRPCLVCYYGVIRQVVACY